MSIVEQLARRLLGGHISLEDFVQALGDPRRPDAVPSDQVQFDQVNLDLDRQRRCGFPEVIYGEGKSADTICEIIKRLAARKQNVLVTRLDSRDAETVVARFPQGNYNPDGRTYRWMEPAAGSHRHEDSAEDRGRVAVVTAGTSDAAIAQEAQETLRWMEVELEIVDDVGVAGPQRLQNSVERLRRCDAVVVVAGMEGALPSVVGGYVACPVIGVPTSVGYGANFGGVSALLSMLNSCASNVTVVNIDAGFKGAYVAGLIATRKNQQSLAD